jgi:type IV fimbrial biogenesis protein FimT
MQGFSALAARRAQRGLTLIEMCAVGAIVAILAGSAAPAFDRLHTRRTLEGTAVETLTDLHYARSEAVARNQRVRVSYLAAADGARCMLVYTGTTGDCQCAAGGVAQCVPGAQLLKSHGFKADSKVSIQSNVSTMTIDPVRGMFTLGGKIQIVQADGTEIRHVVTPAGRIRTCAVDGKVSGYPAC